MSLRLSWCWILRFSPNNVNNNNNCLNNDALSPDQDYRLVHLISELLLVNSGILTTPWTNRSRQPTPSNKNVSGLSLCLSKALVVQCRKKPVNIRETRNWLKVVCCGFRMKILQIWWRMSFSDNNKYQNNFDLNFISTFSR